MDSNLVLYCHLFIDKSKGIFNTFKIVVPNFHTKHILEFKGLIEKELDNLKKQENSTTSYTIEYVSKTLHSQGISDSLKLSAYFKHRDDIFCCVSKFK